MVFQNYPQKEDACRRYNIKYHKRHLIRHVCLNYPSKEKAWFSDTLGFRAFTHGGFHGHGGTPRNGWFTLLTSWKIPLKWMITRGTPIYGNLRISSKKCLMLVITELWDIKLTIAHPLATLSDLWSTAACHNQQQILDDQGTLSDAVGKVHFFPSWHRLSPIWPSQTLQCGLNPSDSISKNPRVPLSLVKSTSHPSPKITDKLFKSTKTPPIFLLNQLITNRTITSI